MVLLSETKRLLLLLLLLNLLPTLPDMLWGVFVEPTAFHKTSNCRIRNVYASVNVDASPRIYNNVSAAVWSINLAKHNWKSIPDSEQLRRWKLSLAILLLYVQASDALHGLPLLSALSMYHTTLSPTLLIVSESLAGRLCVGGGFRWGVFGESIFSSEFLSFVLQRW